MFGAVGAVTPGWLLRGSIPSAHRRLAASTSSRLRACGSLGRQRRSSCECTIQTGQMGDWSDESGTCQCRQKEGCRSGDRIAAFCASPGAAVTMQSTVPSVPRARIVLVITERPDEREGAPVSVNERDHPVAGLPVSTEPSLVLPFDAIEAGMVAVVGGKAANLGELARAGLPVPPGFCVTTAAYSLVAAGAQLEPVLEELAALPVGATDRMVTLAAAARARLLAAPVPAEVTDAVLRAYAE